MLLEEVNNHLFAHLLLLQTALELAVFLVHCVEFLELILQESREVLAIKLFGLLVGGSGFSEGFDVGVEFVYFLDFLQLKENDGGKGIVFPCPYNPHHLVVVEARLLDLREVPHQVARPDFISTEQKYSVHFIIVLDILVLLVLQRSCADES